jgi:uroporphyrinogen decarboxylase
VFADGLIKLRDMFRFDGILVSLHGHNPAWRDDVVKNEKDEDGNSIVWFKERKEIHSLSELPLVKYHTPFPKADITQLNVAELPNYIDYIPVSSGLYFKLNSEHLYTIFDYLYDKTDGLCSIHGEITSPFDYMLDLMGYEQALIALILDPEKCHQFLAHFTKGIKKLALGMCVKPIDAIKLSSPFAGMGFISPQHYSEYVLPYEREIAQAVRTAGKHIYTHTCGHISDRLELMRDTGISGIECLDPEPVGNVDLHDAFDRIGDTMFIKGNIDSVYSLLFADEVKAEEDVRHIIETGKKGKGFILSTACSIAPKVTKERLYMLSRLVERYGRHCKQ